MQPVTKSAKLLVAAIPQRQYRIFQLLQIVLPVLRQLIKLTGVVGWFAVTIGANNKQRFLILQQLLLRKLIQFCQCDLNACLA